MRKPHDRKRFIGRTESEPQMREPGRNAGSGRQSSETAPSGRWDYGDFGPDRDWNDGGYRPGKVRRR